MEHPLTAYRRKHGLTLEALAQRAGTSKATLSRIENNGSDPSVALIRRLMEQTGLPWEAFDPARAAAE